MRPCFHGHQPQRVLSEKEKPVILIKTEEDEGPSTRSFLCSLETVFLWPSQQGWHVVRVFASWSDVSVKVAVLLWVDVLPHAAASCLLSMRCLSHSAAKEEVTERLGRELSEFRAKFNTLLDLHCTDTQTVQIYRWSAELCELCCFYIRRCYKQSLGPLKITAHFCLW